MSSFKAKPKQKSAYPGILSRAEEQRKRGKVKITDYNSRVKRANVKLFQRFSGKRGS